MIVDNVLSTLFTIYEFVTNVLKFSLDITCVPGSRFVETIHVLGQFFLRRQVLDALINNGTRFGVFYSEIFHTNNFCTRFRVQKSTSLTVA